MPNKIRPHSLVHGRTSLGINVPVQVDASGILQTSGSSNGGTGYSASVTLTRTADTNAYAASDVLGAATGSTAALTFASMGPSASRIRIKAVSIRIDASTLISGEGVYMLHLYSVTPPSALGDNAAFDVPAGDRASYLGAVVFGTPVDLGSTLFVENNNIEKDVLLAGTSLFGYLVTVSAYTPTSARVHTINLQTQAV